LAPLTHYQPQVKHIIPKPRGEFDDLVKEVNALHDEISKLSITSANRAIEIGKVIFQLRGRIPRPQWRKWVEANLTFSYRSAKRYLRIFCNRSTILRADIKTVEQAERFLIKASKAVGGKDAIEADYARIDRDLVAPIRLVRKRLQKITYKGDDPETMEMIMEKLRYEAEGLVADLEEN
jgi:hypothetical protein